MRMFLAGGCLALVSFLAGHWTAPRPAQAPPQVELPIPADASTARALEQLAAEVRGLREDLALRSTPNERHELAPGAPAAANPELADSIGRLERVAAQLSRNAAASSVQLATPRDPAAARSAASLALFSELEALRSEQPRRGDPRGDEHWKEVFGAISKRWEDSHRGWTLQQVEERYGAPDRLQADGEGPSYVYEVKEIDGGHKSIVFQSRHGLIYDVDIYVGWP